MSAGFILLKSLDMITIIIPPALPAAMAVGASLAISRLKKKNVFCTSPPRINVAGKVNSVVFDKTGTLTEEGLDLFCVYSTKNRTFSMMEKEFEKNSATGDLSIFHCLCTCHSLKVINGKIVGDPLDLKMFESTQSVSFPFVILQFSYLGYPRKRN